MWIEYLPQTQNLIFVEQKQIFPVWPTKLNISAMLSSITHFNTHYVFSLTFRPPMAAKVVTYSYKEMQKYLKSSLLK
jgi:hypothetical protein